MIEIITTFLWCSAIAIASVCASIAACGWVAAWKSVRLRELESYENEQQPLPATVEYKYLTPTGQPMSNKEVKAWLERVNTNPVLH